MGKRVLAFLLCFLFASGVLAADIERAAITYKGTTGMFFADAVADKLLLDLEEFKTQRARIQLLNTKLDWMDKMVFMLTQDVKMSDEISEKHKANYTLEHTLRAADADRCAEKLAKKNAWYKAPGFWFSIGFVIAGALAVGLSFSLQETRN